MLRRVPTRRWRTCRSAAGPAVSADHRPSAQGRRAREYIRPACLPRRPRVAHSRPWVTALCSRWPGRTAPPGGRSSSPAGLPCAGPGPRRRGGRAGAVASPERSRWMPPSRNPEGRVAPVTVLLYVPVYTGGGPDSLAGALVMAGAIVATFAGLFTWFWWDDRREARKRADRRARRRAVGPRDAGPDDDPPHGPHRPAATPTPDRGVPAAQRAHRAAAGLEARLVRPPPGGRG